MTVNTKYFDKIIETLEAIPALEEKACDELNKMMQEIEIYLQKQLQKLLEEIASLSIIANIPHDIDSVIEWITNVVAKISGPLAEMNADYLVLATKYTEIMAAIAEISSGLHCNLEVSPPTIPPLP